MTIRRCHSPFKHYEMFHGNAACTIGSGGSSSIFNVYNVGVGGGHCHGGFWSGFGSGIGLGLGNLFGGLFSGLCGGFSSFFGGMGFGFPGFGMGGFGGMFGGLGGMFGGLGGMFGGFSGLSGLWGGNNNSGNCNCNCHSSRSSRRSRSSSSRSDSTSNTRSSKRSEGGSSAAKSDCEGKDAKKLRELGEKLDNLKNKSNLTQAELKALYDEVEPLTKNDLDPAHSEDDKANYKRLLGEITDFAKSKGWDLKAPTTTTTPTTTTPTTTPTTPGVGTKNELETTLAQMSGRDGDAKKDLTFIQSIPDNVRSQYYVNGYTNYDGSEDLTDKDVIRAHDNSGNTRDTEKASGKSKATITKAANGNHPQTIVIHDREDITYTFVGKAGSEYLYRSDQDRQLYALQKNSSGQYELMQYAYMKGYGYKDWS